MTLLEELKLPCERLPNTFCISKESEETLYHYAKQMNCSEDAVLDMQIQYMGLTESINKFLKDIDMEFNSSAWR